METTDNPYQSPLTAGGVPDAAPELPRGVWRTSAAVLCLIPCIGGVVVAIYFWGYYYANRDRLPVLQLWQQGVLLGFLSFGLVWLAASRYWWLRRDRWAWGLTILGLLPFVAIILTELL